MKKITGVKALLLISLMSVPFVALAAADTQVTKGFDSLGAIVTSFNKNVVSGLATLFATMAMVAFFWGIVQYIWGVRDGKPEKVSQGNSFMIWGLVALFVMFSVWGIVKYAQTIFGIEGQSTIIIPTIQIDGKSISPKPSPVGLPAPTPTPTSGTKTTCTANDNSPCAVPVAGGGTRPGTCTLNDEKTLGCYVTPGTGTGGCPAGEAPGQNGVCYPPVGFE